MANAKYDEGRVQYAKGDIRPLTDTIKVLAVESGLYTYSAAHTSLANVAASARIGSTTLSAGKTVTSAAAFDATDITISNPLAKSCAAIIYYKDTGTEATSTLIAYLDTGLGLPKTSNPLNIAFDAGTARIWQMV